MNSLVRSLNLSYLPLLIFGGNFKILAHLKFYASLFESWECGMYTVNVRSRGYKVQYKAKEELVTEAVKEPSHEI